MAVARRVFGFEVDEELANALTVAVALRQPADPANIVLRSLFGAMCLARRPLRLLTMGLGVFESVLVPVATPMSVRYSQMIRGEIGPSQARVNSKLPDFDALTDQVLRTAEKLSAGLMGVNDVIRVLVDEPRPALLAAYREWGLDADALVAGWAEATEFAASSQPEPPSTKSGAESGASVLLSGYTADTHHGQTPDLIGGVEREAAAFARVCASRDIAPPLAIGVFGPWGSGKSYFLDKVHARVEELVERHRHHHDLFHANIVQIRFNAWHYIEANLWASLVEHIFTELDNWLREDERPANADKVDALFERLSTSRLLKLEAVTELIARRRRRAEAKVAVAQEHATYLELLRVRQAEREREFPWHEVLDALREDPRWLDLDLRSAGEVLGVDDLADSGTKLVAVLDQSVAAGGRLQMLVNSLSARFGQTWPHFIVLVGVAALLPVFVAMFLNLVPNLAWDSIQTMVASACMVLATLAAMIGKGLELGSAAIERVEQARGLFGAQLHRKQAELRQELTAAEDALGKAEAAVGRAETRLEDAEREVREAAEAFKWGTARGRLNRFIRDKVTSGDYAKHLGLVTSIRRDFVELARLIEAVGDTRAAHESTRFEQDYERRVLATIRAVVSDYARSATPAALTALRRALPAKVNERLLLGFEPLPEPAPPQPGDPAPELEPDTPELEPDTLLSLEEIHKLCAGLDAPKADDLPAFQRIILYIDDLDRCPPDKVVEVLQAAHLLLGFPLFIVLIAVDERWVSRALARHYSEMIAEPGSRGDDVGAATSHDYLEKIFQIPYWVRPMAASASESFLAGLLDASPKPRVRATPSPGPGPGSDPAVGSGASPEPSPDPSPDPGADPGAEPGAEPGADSSDEAQPTPATPRPPLRTREIEAMRFDAHEREFLVRLAPFAGDSPRRGKRFINAYRLIKAGLVAGEVSEFVGAEGESSQYRALLIQLAIATGAPEVAGACFEGIGAGEELGALMARLRTKPDAGGERARMLGALALARDEGLTTQELAPWTSLARRYSFVTRDEIDPCPPQAQA